MPYDSYFSQPAEEPLGSVLLISRNPILRPALAAALTALGWQVSQQDSWQPADGGSALARHLVSVADEAGVLPDGPPGRPPVGIAYLAVGSRLMLTELVRAVTAGAATAVDVDQPFTDLAARLHRLLLNPLSPERTGQFAQSLGARAAAADRFSGLTSRERQVLVALVQGRTAAEIADREHLSMPTVRSHIRSILAKLNSSSQLAAITLTYSACGLFDVVREMRELHHF